MRKVYKDLRKRFEMTILLFCVLIMISGCILSPSTLEKVIIRNSETDEGEQVIEFIEKYDFLDFLQIEPDNSYVYNEFDPIFYQDTKFIRNISTFLTKTVEVNKAILGREGKLGYYINCINLTHTNISDIESIVLKEHELGKFAAHPSFGFDSYNAAVKNNSEVKIIINEEMNYSLNQICEKIDIPEVFWFLYVGIGYSWSAASCESYEFSELIFVTPNFQIFGLFSVCEGLIC